MYPNYRFGKMTAIKNICIYNYIILCGRDRLFAYFFRVSNLLPPYHHLLLRFATGSLTWASTVGFCDSLILKRECARKREGK